MGLTLIKSAVKRTGRVSLLVFLLAGVILTSAVLIPIYSAIKFYVDYMAGKDVFGFNWIF